MGAGVPGVGARRFDRLLASPVALPDSLPVRSFAELVFGERPGEDDGAPVILGAVESGPAAVSLAHLRHGVLRVVRRLAAEGIAPGDTVCLVRLPRTSEALFGLVYAALSAWGVRVLLPMFLEIDQFGSWLARSRARAVVWSAREVLDLGRHEADRELLERLGAVAAARGVATVCLHDAFGLPDLLAGPAPPSPGLADPEVAALVAGTGPDTESLILTTSGSTGRARLVRFRQGAFLRSCASWEAAGMFAPDTLGGRSLCLLLCHSMGVRAFWNAIWTRQAICLVHPEWFAERPERVRALLLQMRPEHVTGGPAVYRTLLALGRAYPDLKDDCFRALRCGVSSGAAFEPDLVGRLRAALGLRLENAFGMTETLQALTTLAPGPFPVGLGLVGLGRSGLGNPLPGVRIGLEAVPADGPSLYRLSIASAFGFAGYLDGPDDAPRSDPAPEWFTTGDLVSLAAEGLTYAGREAHDFVKDGFGVKVPRPRLDELYGALAAPIEHVECFPLREDPGLAAVVFVRTDRSPADPPRGGADAPPDGGLVTDRRVLDRVESLLEARHERLADELEDFERRHLTIARFACVAGPPPRTAKGNVAGPVLAERHAALVDRLVGPLARGVGVVRLDRARFVRPRGGRFVQPRRGELLRLARLDKEYVRAEGDVLAFREEGREVEVVDFVGGFGGNLLGHRHPEVIAAAVESLGSPAPAQLDQGSSRARAGDLARRLSDAVGAVTGASYVVCFGSTGAEAVEIALAHAMVEREERVRKLVRRLKRRLGARFPDAVAQAVAALHALLGQERPVVLAIRGGFHGHSLGARSVLSRRSGRRPFQAMLPLRTLFLPPDGGVDVDALVRAQALVVAIPDVDEGGRLVHRPVRIPGVIAAVAEPILGEGGGATVSPDLLRRLAAHEFPLILDEIQTGLGRTGSFLASAHPPDGVVGDYYLFGKALGGGVAKVSAALVERRRYVERFDELYSSTFAADGFSAAVATRVLSIIARDDVPARARERGERLRAALEAVRADFPDIVRDVHGRGLLLTVELDRGVGRDHLLLRSVVRRDQLGILAAAWLLNRHRIRVLPTLSAPRTLRVEPSVAIGDAAIDRLAAALRALAQALRDGDGRELFGFLAEGEQRLTAPGESPEVVPHLSAVVDPPARGATRIAFLNHFVHPERELVALDPTMGGLTRAARRAIFRRLMAVQDLRPVMAFARSLFGGRVWFASIALPVDAATLEELQRADDRRLVVERIQEAAELGASLGCEILALGGYTSILTRDGTELLPPPGVRVTSGNAFTVAAGARRLVEACVARGVDLTRPDSVVAVVGAAGNIGAGIVHALAGRPEIRGRLLLVGRRRERLEALRRRVDADRAAAGRAPLVVDVTTDLGDLRSAAAIAVATGTNEPLLYRQHLRVDGPVVVADVSVPSVVSAEARRLPNVHVLPFAGTVAVPGEPDFSMSSHTADGAAFCCAAEAMILGLDPTATAGLSLVGPVASETVQALDAAAERLGFYASFGEGGFRRDGGEGGLPGDGGEGGLPGYGDEGGFRGDDGRAGGRVRPAPEGQDGGTDG